MSPVWTDSFHGIQHLQGLKKGYQITVTEWLLDADCDVFVPGCGFTSIETTHRTIEQARAHGVEQAKLLGAFL